MKTMKRLLNFAWQRSDKGNNKAVLEEMVWKDLWEHIFSGFAWLA